MKHVFPSVLISKPLHIPINSALIKLLPQIKSSKIFKKKSSVFRTDVNILSCDNRILSFAGDLINNLHLALKMVTKDYGQAVWLSIRRDSQKLSLNPLLMHQMLSFYQ